MLGRDVEEWALAGTSVFIQAWLFRRAEKVEFSAASSCRPSSSCPRECAALCRQPEKPSFTFLPVHISSVLEKENSVFQDLSFLHSTLSHTLLERKRGQINAQSCYTSQMS